MKNCLPKFWLIGQLLCLLLLVSGCATTQPGQSYESKYYQDEEEIVEVPYTPRDDGKPLSNAELKAFRSCSEFDRDLSQEEAEIVELHFKYFVHERRQTFERYLTRSARYLPYVKKIFVERGLPEDLAYLFMVESGGNPNAISPAGAVGLWQFMPFTGKKFGLEQSSWYDARRDPFRATYAATDYLLKLYDDFDDWHLAAAAYNAGEGKIGRGIKQTGATDFFELCRLDCVLDEKARLRDETRQYVPRLIAIAKIMRNLKLLGFSEPHLDEAYDLQSIDIPPGTNLSAFARTLGLTWSEFSAMNPAFKRTASPPNQITTAYIPPDAQIAAQSWLQSKDARMYAGLREYTVKRQDTLASIAKRHKITVAALQQANGIQTLPPIGTLLVIPSKGQSVEPIYTALPERDAPVKAKSGSSYVVAPGDSLYSLSQKWGTDVKSIMHVNRLSSDQIKPGQRLSIPTDSKTPPVTRTAPPKRTAKSGSDKHTVQKGDTLFSISQRYGVSVSELCKANDITEKTKLSLGKKLIIPGGQPKVASQPAQQAASRPQAVTSKTTAKPKTPAGKTTKRVTIQKGDTLYSLARKHNVPVEAIKKANKMTESTKLQLGKSIIIP